MLILAESIALYSFSRRLHTLHVPKLQIEISATTINRWKMLIHSWNICVTKYSVCCASAEPVNIYCARQANASRTSCEGTDAIIINIACTLSTLHGRLMVTQATQRKNDFRAYASGYKARPREFIKQQKTLMVSECYAHLVGRVDKNDLSS